MKSLVCNTSKSFVKHIMSRCPFCHAEYFMFWGRYADIVNQSGRTDVRVLEVSQQVGRSPQGYTISRTWQNSFEVDRFQRNSRDACGVIHHMQ